MYIRSFISKYNKTKDTRENIKKIKMTIKLYRKKNIDKLNFKLIYKNNENHKETASQIKFSTAIYSQYGYIRFLSEHIITFSFSYF